MSNHSLIDRFKAEMEKLGYHPYCIAMTEAVDALTAAMGDASTRKDEVGLQNEGQPLEASPANTPEPDEGETADEIYQRLSKRAKIIGYELRPIVPVVSAENDGRRIDEMMLSKAAATYDPSIRTSIGEAPVKWDGQVDCSIEQPEDRLAECQRQANELIEARDRTIGFLEDEIKKLRANKRVSSGE